MTGHLILLGDSIFDNAPYVEKGEAVIHHIQPLLKGWSISLLAVDGDITKDIEGQASNIPSTATHLALSIGGNDALQSIPALKTACGNVMEALTVLSDIRESFRANYQAALNSVISRNLPLIVSTIYDQVPGLQPELQTALALFNEVILLEAAKTRLPVLDLRLVCSEFKDFSSVSPIEPSSIGGQKIAKALSQIFLEGETTGESTRIYAH